MITWIRNNTALFSLAAGLVIVISSAAVGWHQLQGLVAQQAEVQKHITDNARHVDPDREKELREQVEQLEYRVGELEARRRAWELLRERNDNRRTDRAR